MAVTINGSAGVTTNSGAVYNSIQGATAVASTSGTSIDFTGIPSWVERVTVMLSGVSTNGTSSLRIQIGSGSVEASGYLGSSSAINGAGSASCSTYSSGFDYLDVGSAATVRNGAIILSLIGSNIWSAISTITSSDASRTMNLAGSKTTSGTLDRVRITTVGGTDTFDAGTINILYE